MGVEYSISNKNKPDSCAWWKNNRELADFVCRKVKLIPIKDNPDKWEISRDDVNNIIEALLDLYKDSYKSYYRHINDLTTLRDEAGSADILLYDVYGSSYALLKEYSLVEDKIAQLDEHWESDGEVLMTIIKELIKMLAMADSTDTFVYMEA